MVNVNITIYLPDNAYKIYIENKKEINAETREYFKKLVKEAIGFQKFLDHADKKWEKKIGKQAYRKLPEE